MKIMYYELIKMLMDYDKKQQSEEEYFVTNTIHKIEGYQQLTNKVNIKFPNFIQMKTVISFSCRGISTRNSSQTSRISVTSRRGSSAISATPTSSSSWRLSRTTTTI